MQLDWTDFPDAPEMGAFLCALADIPKGRVLSKSVNGFGFLALVIDGTPRAYVNACPHQFLPLDQKGNNLLSADGLHLLCTNHSAVFRAMDGQGTAGEGLDCALSAIPVYTENGALLVGPIGG